MDAYETDTDRARRDPEEYRRDYAVDGNGLIRRPGKFEGERAYMPLAFEQHLEGCSDETADGKVEVDFTDEMRAVMPGTKRRKRVRFVEDSYGFVYETK